LIGGWVIVTETRSNGRLERTLRDGLFAVTAETTPPLTADPDEVVAKAAPLKGRADAVNVTSGAGARLSLSAVAAAGLLARAGIEPVVQFTTRDHNLLALQADVLGAAALGVPNVLCLGGDDVGAGDEPTATAVHDLDSAGLAGLIRDLRDTGQTRAGRALLAPPRLFIGMADLPVDPAVDWEPDRLEAKIAAGADFFQTQYCFDLGLCRRYMARLADTGITARAHFLIGLAPFRSARQARWMDENLYGVSVPGALIARLDAATDEAAEGRRICLELIEELRAIPGVAGVHLMVPNGEAQVARVIDESGLLERRAVA